MKQLKVNRRQLHNLIATHGDGPGEFVEINDTVIDYTTTTLDVDTIVAVRQKYHIQLSDEMAVCMQYINGINNEIERIQQEQVEQEKEKV